MEADKTLKVGRCFLYSDPNRAIPAAFLIRYLPDTAGPISRPMSNKVASIYSLNKDPDIFDKADFDGVSTSNIAEYKYYGLSRNQNIPNALEEYTYFESYPDRMHAAFLKADNEYIYWYYMGNEIQKICYYFRSSN